MLMAAIRSDRLSFRLHVTPRTPSGHIWAMV